MGYDGFAYIVEVRDHSFASIRQACDDLCRNPPPNGTYAHTSEGGYSLTDRQGLRFPALTIGLPAADLERIAMAVIRNLNHPPKAADFPENPWAEPAWDDEAAHAFFREHAGKWGYAVVLPLEGHRVFIFGKAGG